MDSLSTGLVAQTLQRLFTEAEQADRALMEQYSNAENPDQLAEDFAEHFAEERRDVRGFYRGYVDNFLNVTPEYGRFLYQCARARKATRIIEFGTSMGISTIYLAAALHDMGGGKLIGTELEASKAARARQPGGGGARGSGRHPGRRRAGNARRCRRRYRSGFARRSIQPLSSGAQAA